MLAKEITRLPVARSTAERKVVSIACW